MYPDKEYEVTKMNTLPFTVTPEDTKHMGINFNLCRVFVLKT